MQDYHEFLQEILVPEDSAPAADSPSWVRRSAGIMPGKDLLLVCILRGGVMFLTDLMRQITVPHMVDFMSVSSYGVGARQSLGQSRINLDLNTDIRERQCSAGGGYRRQRAYHQSRDGAAWMPAIRRV